MKNILCLLCVLILSVPLCTAAAGAAETDVLPCGVCAVVSDQEGHTEIRSADAVGEADDFESYELYVDRKPVLTVGALNRELAATNLPTPTFYHAEFMIPDTSLQVYLTGLRSQNVEELQQRLVDSFVQGASFDLTDLSFIDTEKTAIDDGDENLCWAAAVSNTLYYTGWGAKAGFADENALFDLFASSFTDNGSHQENGMAWFFNGAALQNNRLNFVSAKIKNYPNSGKYLRDYAYDMVSGYELIREPADMNRLFERHRQGCGTSLGINLEQDGQVVGSHAVTLWGTVTDLSCGAGDAGRYYGLLISDSDSHMIDDPDRRTAERVLSYYPLYLNQFKRYCFDYVLGLTAIMDDFEYLLPYSGSLPRETDLTSGRDKTKYPDLRISEANLSDRQDGKTDETLFESGTTLYFDYTVSSAADKAWRSAVKTKRTVINSAGEELFSDVDSISVSLLSGLNYTDSTATHSQKLADVPAGDYTLTFTVNPNRDTAEAYYYNNTRSITFRVRDSFIHGDADNDGTVNILDATSIQRVLAGLDDGGGKFEERGDLDGDGLDILDATRLQRFLAGIEYPYPIGEKALYQQI